MPDNIAENNTNPTITPTTELSSMTPPPVAEMPVVTTPSASSTTKSGGNKKGLIITSVLALAAIVTIGVLSLSIRNSTQEATTPSQAISPTATQIKTLALNLTDLNDGAVASTKTLTVTGSTNVKSTVTIVGGADDVILETDGNFTVDVPLAQGENKLIFTAQDSSENQVTTSRSVFFTEDKILGTL